MIKKCFMFLPIIDTNTVTTKIVLEKCVFMVPDCNNIFLLPKCDIDCTTKNIPNIENT